MDRAERTGLGVALAGHVALLALLSLGLVSTAKLPPMRSEPLDVQFVDEVGRQSAAPQSTEAPAPSEAPVKAKPEEESPPEPAPPKPKPTPPPPPESKPAPPKPAPPQAEPKPAPEKAEPKPKPPEPTPPKPAKVAKAAPVKEAVEKPAAKPVAAASAKPAPKAAAAPAKSSSKSAAAPAATDDRPRRRPDRSEEGGAPAKPAKAAGSRLGPDFLKGIADAPSKAKGQTPKAATVSALQLAGLGASIKRQVQPCYELGSLQGTSAMSIVTTLDIRFNRDGTVAGTPAVADHAGVTDENRAYVRQIDDVARRAVLRCAAPIHLPPELYEGGWDEINLRFTPGQMQ